MSAAPPGSGLAHGLAVTLKTMLRRTTTQQYPDVAPDLPPRSRGVIGLLEENCTVCMLCARECPDWCIYIDSHKETIPAREEGGRSRSRNVLDRFAIDFALCMYCGICIDVCPFDALFWSPEFEYAEYDIGDLTHEKDRLREWMWTVPAPAPLDPDGEEAKEVTAAKTAGGPPVAGRRRTPAPVRPSGQPEPGTVSVVHEPAEVAPGAAQAAEADSATAEPFTGGSGTAEPAAADPTTAEPAEGGQA